MAKFFKQKKAAFVVVLAAGLLGVGASLSVAGSAYSVHATGVGSSAACTYYCYLVGHTGSSLDSCGNCKCY